MKLSKMLLTLFSVATVGGSKAHRMIHHTVSLTGTDAMNCSVELDTAVAVAYAFPPDYRGRIVRAEKKAMQDLLANNSFALTLAPTHNSQNKSVTYPLVALDENGRIGHPRDRSLGVTILSNLTLSAPTAVNFALCLLAFANSSFSTLPEVLRAAAQREIRHEINADEAETNEIVLIALPVLLVFTAVAVMAIIGMRNRSANTEVTEALQPLASRAESYGSVSEGVRSDMAAFETEEARSSSPRR